MRQQIGQQVLGFALGLGQQKQQHVERGFRLRELVAEMSCHRRIKALPLLMTMKVRGKQGHMVSVVGQLKGVVVIEAACY